MLHCEFPIGALIPIFKKCGAKNRPGRQECYIVNSQLALLYPFSRNVEQKIDREDKNATL